jgi:hypothetical protein
MHWMQHTTTAACDAPSCAAPGAMFMLLGLPNAGPAGSPVSFTSTACVSGTTSSACRMRCALKCFAQRSWSPTSSLCTQEGAGQQANSFQHVRSVIARASICRCRKSRQHLYLVDSAKPVAIAFAQLQHGMRTCMFNPVTCNNASTLHTVYASRLIITTATPGAAHTCV